jgi:hypothetical protein
MTTALSSGMTRLHPVREAPAAAVTSDRMSHERDLALDEFFNAPSGRARSTGDAVALATDALKRLEEDLEIAGELDQDADTGARGDAEDRIHQAAIALGWACIDGLRGLVISGAVDLVSPRRAATDADAPPLDDAWQGGHNPFMALAQVASAQRESLGKLGDQPNQVYQHLHDAVALAADVAAWTSWTQGLADAEGR